VISTDAVGTRVDTPYLTIVSLERDLGLGPKYYLSHWEGL
jgi:hypothetical protein